MLDRGTLGLLRWIYAALFMFLAGVILFIFWPRHTKADEVYRCIAKDNGRRDRTYNLPGQVLTIKERGNEIIYRVKDESE